MQRIDGSNVHIIIPDDLLKELDRIAKRDKSTRSEVIRRFLGAGVEFYTDFERVGIVRLNEVMIRMSKTVKRSVGQQSLPTTS